MLKNKALAALAIGLWLAGPALAQIQTSLSFPRLAASSGSSTNPDDSENTGFAIVNLDASTATLTFTAYDRTGKPISGTGITNPAVQTLEAGKQLAMVDFQIFGSGLTAKKPLGWVQVDSTVSKVTGFFLTYNNSLSTMDGADAGSAAITSFVLPDMRTNCPADTDGVCTNQILVSNPGSQTADLKFELVRSDGSPVAQSTISLVAKGIADFLLPELFPNALVQASDYIRVTCSSGVVGFQLYGKKGRYIAGMNGQNANSGAKTLYCPQYVTGGEDYRTDLSIINLDNVAGNLTLTLYGNDGAPLGTSRTAPIAANGKFYLTDQKFFLDPGTLATAGYLVINSSGATAQSPAPKLTGSVVFGDPARTRFSSALPLIKSLGRSYIVSHVASNETYFTGLAIWNTNAERITISIQIYDEKGTLLATDQERLLPGQRKSQLLWQYIPAFLQANRSGGYIKLTEVGDPLQKTNFACFALFGTNDLKVLSAIPPQIAP